MRHARTYLMSSAVVAAAVTAALSAGPSGLIANAATHHAATHLGDLTSDAPVTVVASGLAEPRGLSWGPHGQLLVAEAGLVPSACDGNPDPLKLTCWGTTGAVTDVSSGTPVRVAQGLAAFYAQEAMKGPEGVATEYGHVFVLEGGDPQSVPSWLPADLKQQSQTEDGALLDVTGGHASVVANVGNVNYQWTTQHENLVPPGNFPDANPFGLTANPLGGFYVVDGASNTLDSVDLRGHVRVLAFIPNTPAGTDAVPTCVATGRDGAVYVGELTGDGNNGTAANVYRYVPWSHKLTVWQSGLSAITGCGFGANGDFYVTELDQDGFLAPDVNGVVIQIGRDGTRTVLGAGKLIAPAGFAAGPDGSIYVSTHSVIIPVVTGKQDAGQVVKIG